MTNVGDSMIFDVRPEYIKRIMDKGKLNGNRCTYELACVLKYLEYIKRDDADAQRIVARLLNSIYLPSATEDRKRQIKLSTKMAECIPSIRTDSIFVPNRALSLISEIEDIDTEHFVFYALCARIYTSEDKPILLSQIKKGMGICGNKRILAFLKKTDLFSLGIAGNGEGIIELSPKLTKISDKNGITIDNFLNLCYYYDRFKGNGVYTRCRRCGCMVKQNRRMDRRYCKPCADLRDLCDHVPNFYTWVWDFDY